MIKDTVSIHGKFIAELRNPQTGLVIMRKETPNVVTRLGKNLIARMLLDNSGYDTGITYQAVGTGTGAVNDRNTELDTEYARRIITSRDETSSNIAAFFTFFPASEVTIEIQEVATYGHSTATPTADSGILFARALLNIDNTGGEDLSLSYIVTIG